MKESLKSLNKYYLANTGIILAVFSSIILMFAIQFKVEDLQDEIAKTKNQISDCEDRIRLLEVEWVYLTRPERLRQLSLKYLKNNGYALASQVKDSIETEMFGDATYNKAESNNVVSSQSL